MGWNKKSEIGQWVLMSLVMAIFLAVTSVAFSEPDISILWEKDIALTGRKITPYTIKVVEDKNIVRVVGESYIYKLKESPRKQKPELFEYRFNLKDNTAELKTLMAMDERGIAISLPLEVKDSRLIDSNTVMILSRLIPQEQHKSFNYQELTIGSDWQVKTREIPGPTRSHFYTLGACRNINGDVFHCGNSGYIRKVRSDGNVAWDVNYKSDKGDENAFNVAFSESDKMLVAFGCSFESDTQFTTKDSSLWLANLDSKGNFKAKTEFEGITNFGKYPSFCLSKSGNPIVIYDNNAEISSCKIYASKFSKDLKTRIWTTHIFDGNDIMVSRMVLTPFKEDYTLVTFTTFGTSVYRGHNLYFYILDKNGSIINQATFKDVMGGDCLVSVLKDKIFYMAKRSRKKEEGNNTEYVRLFCFKIFPCKG